MVTHTSTVDAPDPEVQAMADAYAAITSRPPEEWGRMLRWLNAKLESDARGFSPAVRL